MDRTFVVAQTSYNRLIASQQQHQALVVPFEENKEVSLDLLLDAQRRLVESESRYFRAIAEYAIATKNVHYVKGTLLDYDGVYLAEGPWPGKAYKDAADMESLRGNPRKLNYASSRARSSAGARCRRRAKAAFRRETVDRVPDRRAVVQNHPVEPTSAIVPATLKAAKPRRKPRIRDASPLARRRSRPRSRRPKAIPAATPRLSPKRLPPSLSTAAGK